MDKLAENCQSCQRGRRHEFKGFCEFIYLCVDVCKCYIWVNKNINRQNMMLSADKEYGGLK